MSAEIQCPRCSLHINTTNRLVTDSCGHQKCRNCLLNDEIGCLECSSTSVQSKPCKLAATSIKIQRNTTFGGSANIPSHIQKIRSETGDEQYHCTECGKKFRSRSQQYYHFGCSNESAKRYSCNYNGCNKRFATRAHLKYHQESHEPNTYACTYCDKVFKHKIILRKHENNHKTEMEICEICQKQFRNKTTLAAHKAVHMHPEMRFKCNNCAQSYATKSTLQQHMLKHGVKRFKCPLCLKLFQRNTILKLHMQRHNRRESYDCARCYKSYSDADALARHTRLHTPTQKFRCIHCDIITLRKDNMQRHVRNMHDNAAFESCVEIIPVEEQLAKQETPLPQTIENSSVIKCIGNVKPVVVPNTMAATALAGRETPPTYTMLTNVKPPATAKKVKYDPIKYYLKILNPDDETVSDADAASAHGDDANEDLPSTSAVNVSSGGTSNFQHELQSTTTMPECEQPVQAQQRSYHGASNFSEMHWRKNFKYAYYQNAD